LISKQSGRGRHCDKPVFSTNDSICWGDNNGKNSNKLTMELNDPFERYPWNSMRGIGLLRQLKKKQDGKVPVVDIDVIPGHMAVTMEVNKPHKSLLNFNFRV
jgi:hypothetical protein